MPATLTFQNVTLCFGETPVLQDVQFTIPAGTQAVLMGPSGCGKTSLLKLAAGLLRPTSGQVWLGTQPAYPIKGNKIRVAVQFQEHRLLPWLTAAENVNAVLSDHAHTLPDAKRLLARFGLARSADAYPAELSGGMAQRVALCRALAAPSELLLLDEPFRGLDTVTKRTVILLVQEFTQGKTLLLVTHDKEEAASFPDAALHVLS